MKKKQKPKQVRKTYTPFERVLLLLPRLSVAECLLVYDVILKPTPEHVAYIRQNLAKGEMRSSFRKVYPNLPVKIVNDAEVPREYGRWVGSKWRPYSKKMIKKYQIPMTISDKPIPT